MKTISGQELLDAVMGVPGWGLADGELVRAFIFKDFMAAMAFVNQVAALAEAAGHHPDIDIRYNRVRLALVSHDAGGITANDMALALKVNGLLD
jgi:4a-hydroxytetrahydrobiopterin dehydratase